MPGLMLSVVALDTLQLSTVESPGASAVGLAENDAITGGVVGTTGMVIVVIAVDVP
jgi:hypothetical protein